MALLLLLLNETFLKYFIYSVFIYTIFRFFRFIYKNFIRKRMNLTCRYGKNSWALITGATDGIGKEFALQLAREGFNIILVSRSADKLKKVAEEVKSANTDIQTETIAFDFSLKTSAEDYTAAFGDVVKKHDVSILVNNVGINVVGNFSTVSIEDCLRFVNINVTAQTMMTKIFSAYLSGRVNKSAVIDLSSQLSCAPLPGAAMYCATKSFNNYLTSALAEEFVNFNVDFLSVTPLFAESAMVPMKAEGVIVITSEQSVAGTLNDLGYEKQTHGHWIHKIQAFLFFGWIPLKYVMKCYVTFLRYRLRKANEVNVSAKTK